MSKLKRLLIIFVLMLIGITSLQSKVEGVTEKQEAALNRDFEERIFSYTLSSYS